jgi:hypothetical protein
VSAGLGLAGLSLAKPVLAGSFAAANIKSDERRVRRHSVVTWPVGNTQMNNSSPVSIPSVPIVGKVSAFFAKQEGHVSRYSSMSYLIVLN